MVNQLEQTDIAIIHYIIISQNGNLIHIKFWLTHLSHLVLVFLFHFNKLYKNNKI